MSAACSKRERMASSHGAGSGSGARSTDRLRTSNVKSFAAVAGRLPPAHRPPNPAHALRAARLGAARKLPAVWLDAGQRDDYYLDLGAEALRRALLSPLEARPKLRADRRRPPLLGARLPLPHRPRMARPAAHLNGTDPGRVPWCGRDALGGLAPATLTKDSRTRSVRSFPSATTPCLGRGEKGAIGAER